MYFTHDIKSYKIYLYVLLIKMLLRHFSAIVDSKLFSRFYTNRSCTRENYLYKRNVSRLVVPTLFTMKTHASKKFCLPPDDNGFTHRLH